jgi:hypothetical protein
MMTNTNTDRADFSNAQHLYDFVELVAGYLSCLGNYASAMLVDFGEDNLIRPPAITFAPGLPATMQPRVYFRYDSRKHRLNVNVSWPVANGDGGWGRPTDADLKNVTTEITVSADKPAAQVARDIANRLLPSYLPLYHELWRRIEAHQASVSDSRVIAERLAGEDHRVREVNDSGFFNVGLGDDRSIGDAWGTVTVSHGKVKIELTSLSEAQAAAVLAALRGENDPNEVAKLRAEVKRLTAAYNDALWGAK